MMRGGMKEYLDAIRKRYINASREEKGRNPHTIAGRKPGCSWSALDSGLLRKHGCRLGCGKRHVPRRPISTGAILPCLGPGMSWLLQVLCGIIRIPLYRRNGGANLPGTLPWRKSHNMSNADRAERLSWSGPGGGKGRRRCWPQLLAALRNLVIGLLRLGGVKNIAAALRHYGWKPWARWIFTLPLYRRNGGANLPGTLPWRKSHNMSNADRLLEGAVDIHVHFAPDPRVERRGNAIEVARQARDMGMNGLVLKSHEYPTQPVAYTVNQIVSDIHLIGGVALDVEVGGLNPHAVECTANMGGRVVWMPTFSAQADRLHKGLPGGIHLLDDEGDLLPEVHSILEIIKGHDMVLATGHISTKECMILVAEARSQGINRVVVTHATTSAFWTGMTLEDMRTLASMGATIEHCLHVMMPLTHRVTPAYLVDAIRFIGTERCIVSSDFGQDFHPMPAEGMRMGIATLLQAGLDEVEVGMVVKDNPSRLLGL